MNTLKGIAAKTTEVCLSIINNIIPTIQQDK